MNPKKILVADDDKNICELVSMYLKNDGFEVVCAYDGQEAVEKFIKEAPLLTILDIMMPKLNGVEACREIKKISDNPIIFLTAKGETFDKVLGLEMGADDYIVKPFEPKELVARVKAVLRRFNKNSSDGEKTLVFENLAINLSSYELSVCSNKIDTPPKELELLHFLASRPNKVFTRNQLLDMVWGYDYFGDSRTVDVHIKRVREKIAVAEEKSNWKLSTVWGVGYKFEINS